MDGSRHSFMDIPVDPLLQNMVEKYPRLFHGSTPSAHSDVQPGWMSLVDDLCFRIDGMLTDEQARLFEVRQIKDKLGTLRFYVSFGSAFAPSQTEADSAGRPEMAYEVVGDCNEEMRGNICAVIEEAISRSGDICSMCGQPGQLCHLSGLMSVRCDVHSTAP